MLEELLNSKMFWMFASVVSGLLLGSIISRFTGSKQNYTRIGMPIIGILLTLLILKYVKLNVAFFHVKYTAIGLVGLFILSLALGYMMYLYGNKKTNFIYAVSFMYCALSLTVFYVFFKDSLKINTTVCPESKDIYLLLKKEDAGFYDINEEGIGYVGQQLFIDGFRPQFLSKGIENELYSDVPVAVEIPTKNGTAHALLFKRNGNVTNADMNLDAMFENKIVKPEELQFGSLNPENGK